MIATLRVDFTGARAIVRGDTLALVGTVAFDVTDGRDLSTLGVVLRSTIKRYDDEADPGLSQIDSDALGGIVILTATTFRMVHPKSATKLFPIGTCRYDVQLDFSTTETWTLFIGSVHVASDSTLSTS